MGEDRGGLLLHVNLGKIGVAGYLYVNMGEDRGGRLLLDLPVYETIKHL